jgi:hypothetical protein
MKARIFQLVACVREGRIKKIEASAMLSTI